MLVAAAAGAAEHSLLQSVPQQWGNLQYRLTWSQPHDASGHKSFGSMRFASPFGCSPFCPQQRTPRRPNAHGTSLDGGKADRQSKMQHWHVCLQQVVGTTHPHLLACWCPQQVQLLKMLRHRGNSQKSEQWQQQHAVGQTKSSVRVARVRVGGRTGGSG